LKYLDSAGDWIELPMEDLDSFIDMIDTAKEASRENIKRITLKACELAHTPPQPSLTITKTFTSLTISKY
jgi:hypothetical protein